MAYDRNYGNRRYVQLLGDPYVNDTFHGMSTYAANVYVLIRRAERPSSLYTRTYNVLLYELRQDAGNINQLLRMGGEGFQDEPMDIVATFQGVYVLALIGNNFCEES